MTNSKNIARIAIVAIVLALGTAGIVTAIGQGAYAQLVKKENAKVTQENMPVS